MREVTHAAEGPCVLTPEDIDDEKGDVAVCLCGLSDDYPFCDGSHRVTADEAAGVRYKYVDGERRRVRLEFVDGGARTEGSADVDGDRPADADGPDREVASDRGPD